MKNQSKTIDRKTARQMRIDLFTKIYIQEYLRNYRPDAIMRAISEKYMIPEQTIRDYIKPAQLRREMAAGKHTIDPNYQSIIQKP